MFVRCAKKPLRNQRPRNRENASNPPSCAFFPFPKRSFNAYTEKNTVFSRLIHTFAAFYQPYEKPTHVHIQQTLPSGCRLFPRFFLRKSEQVERPDEHRQFYRYRCFPRRQGGKRGDPPFGQSGRQPDRDKDRCHQRGLPVFGTGRGYLLRSRKDLLHPYSFGK